jgi:C4-dicarboxylate transporter DctM subunit
MIIAVLLITFLLCMFIGVPIAFSLGFSALATIVLELKVPVTLLVQRMFTGMDLFPLMAVPLFMLTGELMSTGKMVDSVLSLANSLVGHIRGGLAHVNVVASMFFAGITGSAVADTSALGSIEIPMMVRSGYDREFSSAITAASAVVGPIIPPSIPVVLYAMAAQNVSVGALFIAGAIPGVVVGFVLMGVIYLIARRRNYPKREGGIAWRALLRDLRRAFLALMAPLIILGGILGGAFTPTEAAAVAALYALVVGLFVTRDLKVSALPGVLLRSGITSGIVLLVVATANVFSWILATQQIPQMASRFILSISSSPWVFLLLVNLFLLLVGCFMETAAALIILVPILTPVAINMGLNPVHFGFIFVYNLIIGLATPPLGLCLFVSCGIGKISLEAISRAIVPFLLAEIGLLFVFSYIPSISLILPRLFGLLE